MLGWLPKASCHGYRNQPEPKRTQTASWVSIAVTAYQEEKWENGVFLKVFTALLGYIFEKTN